MILICGATGNVGSALANCLHEHGTPFKALCRNPASAHIPAGAVVVAGDLGNPDTLPGAFAGVESIFFMGPGGKLAVFAKHVAAAARSAGVKRIVMLSSISAEMAPDNPIAAEHQEAEHIVMESGCAWTILRGGVFASNTLAWAASIIARAEVRCELPNGPYAAIDPYDIGAAAAAVLEGSGHDGKIYALTGDETITPEEQTQVLAELLGRPIRFVELSEQEAIESWTKASGSAPESVAIIRTLRRPNVPWLQARPDTRRLIGRPTRTYRQWAANNISHFAG